MHRCFTAYSSDGSPAAVGGWNHNDDICALSRGMDINISPHVENQNNNTRSDYNW